MTSLRAIPGILSAPPRPDIYSLSGTSEGIPRASITRVVGSLGSGKTELVARFLAENPTLHTAWIEERLSVYPPAFSPRGVSLQRVVFIEAGGQAAWAAVQALQSSAFQAIVLHVTREIAEVPLRRIQLAAEKAHAFVFLLAERAWRSGNWTVAQEITANPRAGGQ